MKLHPPVTGIGGRRRIAQAVDHLDLRVRAAGIRKGRRIERRDIREVDEVGGCRDAHHFDVVIEVAIRNRCRADRIARRGNVVRIQRLADVYRTLIGQIYS